MQNQRRDLFPFYIALIVLIAIIVPFDYAFGVGGETHRFGGFLLNPLDGYSYLAKMYQGWEGSWRYQMAFTANPGQGVYIQLFYLFIGHVARTTSLPLLVVFHIVRIIGAVILLWALWHFFGVVLPNTRARKLAYALAALGSGMGWLAIPSGYLTADMWVAETYPLLSAYSNPHFTLSLTLVLWLILPPRDWTSPGHWVTVLLGSVVLSVISPFGVILVLIIQGGVVLVRVIFHDSRKQFLLKREEFLQVGLILIAGAPLLIYYFWISQNNPVIAQWNAQNVTPSPPFWDTVLSLSPALILAVIGAWLLIKERPKAVIYQPVFVFIVWAGLGLALVYFPFSLQRRFMMGLYIPMAALAALALEYISSARNSYRIWATLLFILAIPTNLVVLMAGVYGVNTRAEEIFLTQDESAALNWIITDTNEDALILSSPNMGIFIPAFTGRRVIYGHPFETIHAELEEQGVIIFFGGELDSEEITTFLAERDVDFIFYGPREQAMGEINFELEFNPVYRTGEVTLYEVGD